MFVSLSSVPPSSSEVTAYVPIAHWGSQGSIEKSEDLLLTSPCFTPRPIGKCVPCEALRCTLIVVVPVPRGHVTKGIVYQTEEINFGWRAGHLVAVKCDIVVLRFFRRKPALLAMPLGNDIAGDAFKVVGVHDVWQAWDFMAARCDVLLRERTICVARVGFCGTREKYAVKCGL
eukprot:s106_g18.t1